MQRCRDTEELQLVDDHATAESELIGPFQVPIPLILSVSDGHTLADADGMAVGSAIAPGSDFYLRPAAGTSATTITAKTSHNLTGPVLTGVALEAAPRAIHADRAHRSGRRGRRIRHQLADRRVLSRHRLREFQ